MSDVTRIWIWFAGNANIRKWQTTAFEEGTAFVPADEYDALEARASALAEEVERLRASLAETVEWLDDAGTPYIPGSASAEGWAAECDARLSRARALLTQADGGAE